MPPLDSLSRYFILIKPGLLILRSDLVEKQNEVQWVYSSQTYQELEERYDQRAEDYDADLERDFVWQ